jgi:hypothetical protein
MPLPVPLVHAVTLGTLESAQAAEPPKMSATEAPTPAAARKALFG